jgi:hypothetical protein
VKNGLFTEKPLVTKSNCYETIKDASIFIKLGSHIDWAMAFTVTKTMRGHLKIVRNIYVDLFQPK